MRFQGQYHKTLTRLFLTAAFIISLILCLLSGWFLNRQNKSDYMHYLEQSLRSQESHSVVASSVIFNAAVQCSADPDVIQWIDAPTLQEFYFYAIGASRQLRATVADILAVDYTCAIMPLVPKSYNGTIIDMVLDPQSSMNTAQFCQKYNLNTQEYLTIIDYFHENDQPVTHPIYNQMSGELDSLLYVMKSKRAKNPFLLFVIIPKGTIIPDLSADSYFIYNKNGVLACSDNETETLEKNKALYLETLLPNGPSAFYHPQKIQGQYLSVSSIGTFQWLVATLHSPAAKPVSQSLTFGIASFIVIATCLYLGYLLVVRLYTPVRELLDSTPIKPQDANLPVNEFQLIRQNMDKITELGTRLRDAMEENNSLMSIQSYKELLFNKITSDDQLRQFDDPNADYCVAIGETMNPDDEYAFQAISFQKKAAYDMASRRNDVFYINLDYNRYALILKAYSPEKARVELLHLLNQLDNDPSLSAANHRIVLSDAHKGLDHLHLCYQEALKILEFRYLHSKSRVITWHEISSIDAVTYSYPLQTENRLIQCVLDGKDEALTIFDTVVRENIANKDLSKETTQTLIYAFIGTISRIFQELKTTPEEFLGKTLDYRYLYNHWNDSVIFMQIKNILSSVITTIRQRESSRDQELLNQMLNYIYENYWDDIMLNDLADYLNISPKYCGILFKQLSDNNFKDFLNRYRIEKSKELLHQNPNIKIVDLSSMVGFNSSNSFIRVFSKYEGITPGAYLERIQNSL